MPTAWVGPADNVASALLLALSVAPFLVPIDPNYNVIATACLTVFVGCLRSVKEAAPTETMSKESAMRFPLIGSAVLFSLFILFKFFKDLVNLVLTAYFVLLGVIALTATMLPYFAHFLPHRLSEKVLHLGIPKLITLETTPAQLIAGLPASAFCVWYLRRKHWFANNALGLAFSIQGIEILSLGTFKIGLILLAGLFIYDIFWVFCTPVMVSVAKSFDAPIKLLFPTSIPSRPFSMLGLGDIVIPGIFVALALRFDMSRHHGVRYFKSAFFGYILGLATTIVVMNKFQAAQPALLYIVPGVIGALGVHCALNGELQELLEYDEAIKPHSSSSESEGAGGGTGPPPAKSEESKKTD